MSRCLRPNRDDKVKQNFVVFVFVEDDFLQLEKTRRLRDSLRAGHAHRPWGEPAALVFLSNNCADSFSSWEGKPDFKETHLGYGRSDRLVTIFDASVDLH